MTPLTTSRDPLAWADLAYGVIAFAIAAATGIIVWLRKRSARDWPMAQGRVEYASSFENQGVWLTDISYSYSVASEFYSGQFQLQARTEQKAHDHVLRWNGKHIGVRYSSKNPEISVVMVEDQASLHPGEFQGY